MKTVLLVFISLIISQSVFAEDDIAKGKRLFSQSRCLECHSTDIFTQANRKVRNLQQLEQRVRTCDANLNINWFDDEILAVVKFLNTTYYQFPAVQNNDKNE